MSKHTFFITGASGSQGGAVAHQILAAGHKVRAIIRDPTKPSVQKLAQLGATIIEGDFDNISALQDAAKGCYGLFLMSMPTQPAELEAKHAHNIIVAAKHAGVKRIVCSTVTRAEEHESFSTWDPSNPFLAGYWRSKKAVQDAVQEAGFESWTILQPAWIMTNWVAPNSFFYWQELSKEKIMVTAFGADTKIHLTSPSDVGSFAVKALTEEGGTLKGKIVRLAGDELTMGEIAKEMSRISGTEVTVRIRSDGEIESLKGSNPLVGTELWQRFDGSRVDLEEVKKYGVKTTTFKEFLEINKDELVTALGG